MMKFKFMTKKNRKVHRYVQCIIKLKLKLLSKLRFSSQKLVRKPNWFSK